MQGESFIHDPLTPEGRAERLLAARVDAQLAAAPQAAVVNAALAALAVTFLATHVQLAVLGIWWVLTAGAGALSIWLRPLLSPPQRARALWWEALCAGALWGALCTAGPTAAMFAAAVQLQAIVFRSMLAGPAFVWCLLSGLPAAGVALWVGSPVAWLVGATTVLGLAAAHRHAAIARRALVLRREVAEMEDVVNRVHEKLEGRNEEQSTE